MIVKVVGNKNGTYKEGAFDYVEKYEFTNSTEELEGEVYVNGHERPYSQLHLTFTRNDPITITFNTIAYVLNDTGKTVDVLKYDERKEMRYL